MESYSNPFLLYLVVFTIVVGSYLFLQLFMEAPKTQADDLDARNLPPIFRKTYRLLSLFTETLGKPLVAMQSKRAAVIREKLQIADIRMDPEYVLVAEIFFSLVLMVGPALFVLSSSNRMGMVIFMTLICGFIGFIFPSMNIASLADKRQGTIIKNLPFAIDLIGSAMRSGLEFTAAVRYYVSTERKTNPLAVEFGVMLRQLELGKTRIEALEAMARKVRMDEFDSFTAAVAHGTEVGASIVDTMKIQAEEMRRARFNRAERKAARAPSLMILPIAIFIMPAVFFVIGVPVYIKVGSSGLGGMM